MRTVTGLCGPSKGPSVTYGQPDESTPAYPLAPATALTAVSSGRVLQLDAPGVTTVLICFAQETQKDIAAPEAAVRERWQAATDVLVANLIDLHKVPGMFRKIAEGVLSNEHRKAVEAL